MKIARILVALDGSPEAEIALPKAVELAKQHIDAKVVLVRAVDPVTLGEKADSNRRAAAIYDAAEYLGNVAARLRSEGVRPVTRSVWFAGAGHAISEVARTARPDLIVMASRHRSGAGRLVPGPIAEFVRDRTELPIVLVGAADTRGGTARGDVTETRLVHQRELMPPDDSRAAREPESVGLEEAHSDPPAMNHPTMAPYARCATMETTGVARP